MRFYDVEIAGPVVVELERHLDDRGSFSRAFCVDEFAAAGLPTSFPQCNLSTNVRRGTLRGMHYNADPFGESKLVRCVRGSIHDVIVDIRRDSPTRFHHVGVDLSADNGLALFVPVGFAHGFLTIEDATDVYYHMGASHRPGAGRCIRWNDPVLAIDWPFAPSTMSAADASCPNIDPDTFGFVAA